MIIQTIKLKKLLIKSKNNFICGGVVGHKKIIAFFP